MSVAEVMVMIGWKTADVALHYVRAHPDAKARTAAVLDEALA